MYAVPILFGQCSTPLPPTTPCLLDITEYSQMNCKIKLFILIFIHSMLLNFLLPTRFVSRKCPSLAQVPSTTNRVGQSLISQTSFCPAVSFSRKWWLAPSHTQPPSWLQNPWYAQPASNRHSSDGRRLLASLILFDIKLLLICSLVFRLSVIFLA